MRKCPRRARNPAKAWDDRGRSVGAKALSVWRNNGLIVRASAAGGRSSGKRAPCAQAHDAGAPAAPVQLDGTTTGNVAVVADQKGPT